jgi:signal transduction histidine kinase
LLSNAIKFTETGSIQVEVWELTANRIVIAVKDTGIGIAAADLAHIFEEFRQANQSLTREHGGTGLGLAITNRLVHMIQGTIKVESKLGEGSTFRVEIPRKVVVQQFCNLNS